jgi:hypothetical protein
MSSGCPILDAKRQGGVSFADANDRLQVTPESASPDPSLSVVAKAILLPAVSEDR